MFLTRPRGGKTRSLSVGRDIIQYEHPHINVPGRWEGADKLKISSDEGEQDFFVLGKKRPDTGNRSKAGEQLGT
jgi:hypothetical protein